jgi:hypothetical protein
MMTDDLILSFPVLKNGGGDFLEGVSYVVEATQAQDNRKLYIIHTLKGNSFISQLIKDKKAQFSVSLFYKDNAERQNFVCEDFDYDDETKEIISEQKINIDFRYAPEITPNIIMFEDVKITVDNSGLSNFWTGEIFTIPAYARIAHYSKLKFTSGDVSSLMWKDMDKNYSNGVIKTIVDVNKGEGEQPIKIICAQNIYDELDKGFSGNMDIKMAMRQSIVTQILCAVYAHMNQIKDKTDDIHSGLLMHMENVKEKTGQDWENENDFNPSFAATKMIPYAIEALNKGDN